MQVGIGILEWVLVLGNVPRVPALGHFCLKSSKAHNSAPGEDFSMNKKPIDSSSERL